MKTPSTEAESTREQIPKKRQGQRDVAGVLIFDEVQRAGGMVIWFRGRRLVLE
jgi:hypothetical protein